MYGEVDGGSPCSVSILKYAIITCMSLICPHVACQSFKISLFFNAKENMNGSVGIRTHTSEETGALNQSIRLLGHATFQEDLMELNGDNIASFIWKDYQGVVYYLFNSKLGHMYQHTCIYNFAKL